METIDKMGTRKQDKKKEGMMDHKTGHATRVKVVTRYQFLLHWCVRGKSRIKQGLHKDGLIQHGRFFQHSLRGGEGEGVLTTISNPNSLFLLAHYLLSFLSPQPLYNYPSLYSSTPSTPRSKESFTFSWVKVLKLRSPW